MKRKPFATEVAVRYMAISGNIYNADLASAQEALQWCQDNAHPYFQCYIERRVIESDGSEPLCYGIVTERVALLDSFAA